MSKFELVENLNDIPDKYVGEYCEILYFSDCFVYCEVLFADGSQWFIDIKALDPQGF